MKFSDLTLTFKIGIPVLIILGMLMAASSLYTWYSDQFKFPVSQVEYIKQPEIRTVIKIKRVEVPGPARIITIEKKDVVETLKLPDWIKNDINKQVIATAEIPPYEGKTNAVAILDVKTGAGDIVAKQVPLPLFAFENKIRIGGLVGFSTRDSDSSLTGQGQVSWIFFRIGKLHTQVYGEVGRDQKGMVGAYYEF